MPVASMALRASALGSDMRIVMSVPMPSATKVVMTRSVGRGIWHVHALDVYERHPLADISSDKQSFAWTVSVVAHLPRALVRNGRRIATAVAVAAALGAGAGCGRKPLGGPSYDGGLSDLPIGSDGQPGNAD